MRWKIAQAHINAGDVFARDRKTIIYIINDHGQQCWSACVDHRYGPQGDYQRRLIEAQERLDVLNGVITAETSR